MNASEVAARYTQPGKQAARKFVVDLAVASGCKTALDFWGGGTSAREFTRAGLSVVSAELDRSLWSELDRDAAANGYVAHHGRASDAADEFDIVWADYTGHISRKQETETRRLASKARQFLVVTLAPEREEDSFLSRARVASIPALLVLWSSMRLDYISRYQRNKFHQEMWLAVLGRVPHGLGSGKGGGNGLLINPVAIARNMTDRRRLFWASQSFRGQYGGLLPYVSPLALTTQTMTGLRCRQCDRSFVARSTRTMYCSEPCRQRAWRGIPEPRTTCQGCSRVMLIGRADKLYCSRECRDAEWLRRRRMERQWTLLCDHCTVSFSPKKNVPWAKYCSLSCREKAGRIRRGSQSRPAPPIAA